MFNVLKKLSIGINSPGEMSWFCNMKTLKIIYFSLIQSHILIGLILYRIIIYQGKHKNTPCTLRDLFEKIKGLDWGHGETL